MADISFKRLAANANGSIPGELTIGDQTWPTIERGSQYTYARKGEYNLKMDMKNTGRIIRCLRFNHDGIRTHLIHDALSDNHVNLSGCIAPGVTKSATGIQSSATAMEQVWSALGGFTDGDIVTISIENNIQGNETKDQWIARRVAAGKW